MGSAKKKQTSKKSKSKTTDTRYWKPDKTGTSIEGKLKGMISGLHNPAMVLETASGEMFVNINTVLEKTLKHNAQYKQLKPNAKIKVVYIKDAKGKRGKPAKVYDIYVNNKKLNSPVGTVETDISKFFK